MTRVVNLQVNGPPSAAFANLTNQVLELEQIVANTTDPHIIITQSVTAGDDNHAPSGAAVYDTVLAEQERALAAESSNATAISNEVARATGAESTNATAISNEITRATGAESALTTAINGKEPSITSGTVDDFWRGDKTFQPVSDLPISTAAQTALDLKAPLDSPPLTGTPTAPTASGGTNTTQVATTAFAVAEVNARAVRYDASQSLNDTQKIQGRANLGVGGDQRQFIWGTNSLPTSKSSIDYQLVISQVKSAYDQSGDLGAIYGQRVNTYAGGATGDNLGPTGQAICGYNQIPTTINYCNEIAVLGITDNLSWLGQSVGVFGQAKSSHGGRTFGIEAEAKQLPEYYTATASQTVFVVPNNCKSAAAVVVKNGTVLAAGVGYNATAIPGATTSGAITSMSGSGSVVTVAFSGGFTPPVNYSVDISGATPNAYNGRWRVLTSSAGNATLSCAATGTVTVLGNLAMDSTLAGSITLTAGATAGDSLIIARGNPTYAAMGGEAIVYADGGTDNANTISGNRVGFAITGTMADATVTASTNIGTLLSLVSDPSYSNLTVDRGILFQGKFGTAIDFTASNFTANNYLLKFNTSNAGVSANANNLGVGNLGLFTPAGYATVQAGNTTNGGILRVGDNTNWGRVLCATSAGMTVGTETNLDLLFLRNSSEIARFTSSALQPGADNTISNGTASRRWSVIYAATGTINTSDAREKTTLRELSDAELRAIKTIIAGIGVFQYLDAVSEKGADKARLHVGVTAQQVKSAFEAEGLDASRYAAWCEDVVTEKVEKTVKKTVLQQIMDEVVSYDIVVGEDGTPRRVEVKVQVGRTEPKVVLDENGDQIWYEDRDGNRFPMTCPVPVMEEVEMQTTETVEQPLLGADGSPYVRMGLRESHLFWLALAAIKPAN